MDKAFHHLRTDFRLSVITLLAACALIGISPFAIYRFAGGQFTAATVDLAILAGVVLIAGYAYTTQKTRGAGLLMSAVACSGAVAVAMMQRDVGVFWVYPAILATFFMANRCAAIVISVLTVLALVLQPAIFDSTAQLAAFGATCVIVSACAYIVGSPRISCTRSSSICGYRLPSV